MSTLKEAAQQALMALEDACGNRCNAENNPCYQRIVAEVLRAALAQERSDVQPEPEPVRRVQKQFMDEEVFYTSPPQRQPLTESEVNDLYKRMLDDPRGKALTPQNLFQAGVLFAELAHGIGGEV